MLYVLAAAASGFAAPSTPTDCAPPNCRAAATDPYSPNCKGDDYKCLTSTEQQAFGKSPDNGGTFNDFGHKDGNVGYCKMQQKHSHNRSGTMGPKILTTGRVVGGIGLSEAQFAGLTGGPSACGMCLEVSAKMALWDCELTVAATKRNHSTWVDQKIIVMVMDQCKDNWDTWSGTGNTTAAGNCNTGHLDFDVYPTDHSVDFLGVETLSWRAVDCPVGDLPFQFAFSNTFEHMSKYFFAVHLWDLVVPVTSLAVKVDCRNGTAVWANMEFAGAIGWQYQGSEVCFDTVHGWPNEVNLRLTSVHGEVLDEVVNIPPNLTMMEDMVAMPTVPASKQFTVSSNPPSADANHYYSQCVKK